MEVPRLSPLWNLRCSCGFCFCLLRLGTRQGRSATSPKSTCCPWGVTRGLGSAPRAPLPCTASSPASWLQNWCWSLEVGAGHHPHPREGDRTQKVLSPVPTLPPSLAGASPVRLRGAEPRGAEFPRGGHHPGAAPRCRRGGRWLLDRRLRWPRRRLPLLGGGGAHRGPGGGWAGWWWEGHCVTLAWATPRLP